MILTLNLDLFPIRKLNFFFFGTIRVLIFNFYKVYKAKLNIQSMPFILISVDKVNFGALKFFKLVWIIIILM